MTTLTFLTAGCVPGQATPSDMPNDADTAMEEQAEEKLEFNEEYADFLYGGTSIGTLQQNSPYGWSGVPEGIHDLSINSVEEDRHGKYTRVKAPHGMTTSIPSPWNMWTLTSRWTCVLSRRLR